MTNFIALFPLNIVVFPGEKLNLHIFEPRYKQLINDCQTNKKPFGIITINNGEVAELGTSIQILEISKTYEDGRMDIKTEGISVFRILEKIANIPEKLYDGAIVNYTPNNFNGNNFIMEKLLTTTKQIHQHLQFEKKFSKPNDDLNCYDIAHFIGLSLQEELYFLQLETELQRQEYIKRYFKKIMPRITEMELLKEKIKLNGHFKKIII